jgi:hypothetical protein
MESLARSLLGKLLDDTYKEEAGRRARAAALTASNLSAYHECKSLQGREAFEAVMESARMAHAIDLEKANRGPLEGFIVRVVVRDSMVLASFLGREPLNATLTRAREALDPFVGRFPVLEAVLEQWKAMRKVRSHDATSAQEWLDAIKVIDFSEENLRKGIISMPLNVASGKLFKDTKRIRRLEIPLDVLLTGSIEVSGREGYEIWNDIGLFREEHPVRMAGNVLVEREGVTARLDIPYSGLPAESVKRLASVPSAVITIENQTTFHEEARARHEENVLLIYTAGMPNPPWREMYVRILKGLPESVPVSHWGDIDEGGFRIASVLAKEASKSGRTILPLKMHPQNVPEEHRRPASQKTIERMAHFARQAGWGEIAKEIEEAGFTVEQECLW